jgi:hypothetical protein
MNQADTIIDEWNASYEADTFGRFFAQVKKDPHGDYAIPGSDPTNEDGLWKAHEAIEFMKQQMGDSHPMDKYGEALAKKLSSKVTIQLAAAYMKKKAMGFKEYVIRFKEIHAESSDKKVDHETVFDMVQVAKRTKQESEATLSYIIRPHPSGTTFTKTTCDTCDLLEECSACTLIRTADGSEDPAVLCCRKCQEVFKPDPKPPRGSVEED